MPKKTHEIDHFYLGHNMAQFKLNVVLYGSLTTKTVRDNHYFAH